MRRRLSSRLTLFVKAGLLLWWVFFALITVSVLVGAGHRGVFLGVWAFLLLYGAIALAFYGRLRWVFLEGEELIISNYVRTQRVHLSNVVDVRTVRWLRLPSLYVRIDFNERARCGGNITFHARVCMAAIGGSHPIVAELKRLARFSGAELRVTADGLSPPTGSPGE